MAVNTYRNTDSTQLSAHFNVQEFKCQCGKSHDILIDSGLVDKLEALYTTLNCSKIIVTSVTGRMGSQSAARPCAARLRIWALLESLTLQVVISTHTWTCGHLENGMAMKCMETGL